MSTEIQKRIATLESRQPASNAELHELRQILLFTLRYMASKGATPDEHTLSQFDFMLNLTGAPSADLYWSLSKDETWDYGFDSDTGKSDGGTNYRILGSYAYVFAHTDRTLKHIPEGMDLINLPELKELILKTELAGKDIRFVMKAAREMRVDPELVRDLYLYQSRRASTIGSIAFSLSAGVMTFSNMSGGTDDQICAEADEAGARPLNWWQTSKYGLPPHTRDCQCMLMGDPES